MASKNQLSKADLEYPFRIVSPTKELAPYRFKEIGVAKIMFDMIKEEGHQAILSESKVSDDMFRTKILFYSSPRSFFKRKE